MDITEAPELETKVALLPFPISSVDDDFLLDAKDIEAAGGPSQRSLERMRRTGDGPPYTRVGPKIIRYRAGSYRGWLRAQTFAHAAAEQVASQAAANAAPEM